MLRVPPLEVGVPLLLLCCLVLPAQPFGQSPVRGDTIGSILKEIRQQFILLQKELKSKMETVRYDIMCEIRNLKEALAKERTGVARKVVEIHADTQEIQKRLKRNVRRASQQSETIKSELRSQKAEMYAVRNSVFEVKDALVTKDNLILDRLYEANETLKCHMDLLKKKLEELGLEFAPSGAPPPRKEPKRKGSKPPQVTPEPTHIYPYEEDPEELEESDKLLPGCTRNPLETKDTLEIFGRAGRNRSSEVPDGIPENGKFYEEGIERVFPTLPEDCEDSKKTYLEYPPMPRDCDDVLKLGFMETGVYRIQPPGLAGREVLCDHRASEGGWTVIVSRRKLAKHILFNRTWDEYEEGFGDPAREYWIGLKVLYALTKGRPHQLRADMEDWEGNTAWARYSLFSVAGADDNYRLRVSGYNGNAGDSMRHSHLQMFSTIDRDNDQEEWGSCARGRGGGGWWWGRCSCTQPTGQYRRGRYHGPEKGITWWHWKDSNYSLKTLFLKIKPM